MSHETKISVSIPLVAFLIISHPKDDDYTFATVYLLTAEKLVDCSRGPNSRGRKSIYNKTNNRIPSVSHKYFVSMMNLWINFEWLALSRFDVESSDILPSFLEQRDQEVDTHVNVLSELFFGEGEGSNSCSHAKNLLKLESDS